MQKTALIVGSKGQDGILLTQLLKGKGYKIVGLSRDGVTYSDGLLSPPINLESHSSVKEIVRECRPDEIYYLAAIHRSSENAQEDTYQHFIDSFSIHVIGFIEFS